MNGLVCIKLLINKPCVRAYTMSTRVGENGRCVQDLNYFLFKILRYVNKAASSAVDFYVQFLKHLQQKG